MTLAALLVPGLLGLLLLIAGPWLARLVPVGSADPPALARVLQVVGIVLILAALLIRPQHPETTAFPPPPGATREARR